MSKSTNIILKTLTIIIAILFILAISPVEMQNDTFWSIKVGEKLVNEGIFGIDNFSIHEDLYYVAHHFLTDILIYVIHSFSGFLGLYILEVSLALILALVLYMLNKEICGSKFKSLMLLVLQMLIMSMYISVRAQMISFILFALELLLLEKFMKESKKRYIVYLSIIPILLANFHMGAVPFFFVILGVYIISLFKIKCSILGYTKSTDKERLKKLVLVFLIGLITIFINPYFIDGVIYPFKTFGNEFINSTIQEFQALSISFDGGWSLAYIAVIILILVFSRTKIKTSDFLLIFGTLFMAFVAIRYISMFAICSAVVLRYVEGVIKQFNLEIETKKALKVTCLIVSAFLVLALSVNNIIVNDSNKYIPEEVYPVKAVEYIKDKITSEDRIFNYYSWGSYLMLNDIKVYMDSRCDLYTKEYNNVEIAEDYNKLALGEKDYKAVIQKYNLNMFVIPQDLTLSTLLTENEGFELIYSDDTAVIYKQK